MAVVMKFGDSFFSCCSLKLTRLRVLLRSMKYMLYCLTIHISLVRTETLHSVPKRHTEIVLEVAPSVIMEHVV